MKELKNVHLTQNEKTEKTLHDLLKIGFSIKEASKPDHFNIKAPKIWKMRHQYYSPTEKGFTIDCFDNLFRKRGSLTYRSGNLHCSKDISEANILFARSAIKDNYFSWNPVTYFQIRIASPVYASVIIQAHMKQWRNVVFHIRTDNEIFKEFLNGLNNFDPRYYQTNVFYLLEDWCTQWLNTHFPRWRDPNAYWEHPFWQTVFTDEQLALHGEITELEQAYR